MRSSDFSCSIFGYVLLHSNSISKVYDHLVCHSTLNTVHITCSNEPPMKKINLKETNTLRKANRIKTIEISSNSLRWNSFSQDESYSSDSNIESKRAVACDKKNISGTSYMSTNENAQ